MDKKIRLFPSSKEKLTTSYRNVCDKCKKDLNDTTTDCRTVAEQAARRASRCKRKILNLLVDCPNPKHRDWYTPYRLLAPAKGDTWLNVEGERAS